jgi:cytochrome c2
MCEKERVLMEMNAMSIRTSAVVLALGFAVSLPAFSQELGNAKQGQMLADTVCSECHAVKKTALRSPNNHAPTFTSIANTPGMSPMAVRVWLRSAHREMPNLVLKEDEVDNIIAYLQTLK